VQQTGEYPGFWGRGSWWSPEYVPGKK